MISLNLTVAKVKNVGMRIGEWYVNRNHAIVEFFSHSDNSFI